mmetsp:Transcript_44508/g.113268  ORF Transcript_44508/g.113268 Transcript_44508/m.113268 type:complete len:81 (+) Transcript_44508:470-712(+)
MQSPRQPPAQPPGPSMASLMSPMVKHGQQQVFTQRKEPPGSLQHSKVPVLHLDMVASKMVCRTEAAGSVLLAQNAQAEMT